MIYEATVDNLQALMRACIVLDRTQIYRFFSAHHDQSRIDFFIDFLIKERVLDADETKKNRVWLRRQARPISRPKEAVIASRIKAFWPALGATTLPILLFWSIRPNSCSLQRIMKSMT